MKSILTMTDEFVKQKEPYVYKLTDIALIVVVTALVAALFTFCLTEYNIEQDCKAVSAFRIDGTGFKLSLIHI